MLHKPHMPDSEAPARCALCSRMRKIGLYKFPLSEGPAVACSPLLDVRRRAVLSTNDLVGCGAIHHRSER